MNNFIQIEPINFTGLMPSMDIFTNYEEPVTVVFTGRNGSDFDKKFAADHGLKEGALLTVSNIEVGSWSSSVYFQEMPEKSWNSVMFLELDQYLALNE